MGIENLIRKWVPTASSWRAGRISGCNDLGESDSARENEAVKDLNVRGLGILEGFREVEVGMRWGFRRKTRVEEEVRLERGWRKRREAISEVFHVC